jgi:hypothetical protein
MSLRFTDCRKPKTVDELSKPQRAQLQKAWEAYSGDLEDPAKLVADNPGWFELWRVERVGVAAYDFWHMPPDNGRLFLAGRAKPAGISMIQFSFDGDGGDTLGPKLAKLLPELEAGWKARTKSRSTK